MSSGHRFHSAKTEASTSLTSDEGYYSASVTAKVALTTPAIALTEPEGQSHILHTEAALLDLDPEFAECRDYIHSWLENCDRTTQLDPETAPDMIEDGPWSPSSRLHDRTAALFRPLSTLLKLVSLPSIFKPAPPKLPKRLPQFLRDLVPASESSKHACQKPSRSFQRSSMRRGLKSGLIAA